MPGSLLDAKSETINNRTFFPGLPPHLRHQFYFESPYGLRFRGRFIDEGGRVRDKPASEGDAFVLMNVLDDSARRPPFAALSSPKDPSSTISTPHSTRLPILRPPRLRFSPTREGEEPQAADAWH